MEMSLEEMRLWRRAPALENAGFVVADKRNLAFNISITIQFLAI